MPFTVSYPGGTKDAEFPAYARLLYQAGADLGNLPRVPEPDARRKWLAAWDGRDQAEEFRRRLIAETDDPAWRVTEVPAPASVGPLGPLLVQVARQRGRFTFGLHPLGRLLIQSRYPAVIGATSINVDAEAWDSYRSAGGNFDGLVRTVLPALSGLTSEQLAELGYTVLDVDDDRTRADQPPAFAAGGVALPAAPAPRLVTPSEYGVGVG